MNVKPGDMAMVVPPDSFAGSVCTVLGRSPDQWAVSEPLWLVRFPRPMAWDDFAPGCDPHVGSMFDSVLRKIAGPDVPVETTRDSEVPA